MSDQRKKKVVSTLATTMEERQAEEALRKFKEVFGEGVEEYVDSVNDLDLRYGKCKTKAKCLALAGVLETNAPISPNWNGKI